MGSDWPVAPATPLEGIHAAVTRQTLDGKNPGGWQPAQKISVDEALRGYTIDAAYASFGERDTGTLERGKFADFALIDRDITRIPPEEIADARVTLTAVGGRVIHEA
jgi:predicted amidohydrolase YtcJ